MGIAILAEGSLHPVEVSFIGAETVRQSLNLRAADSMLLGQRATCPGLWLPCAPAGFCCDVVKCAPEGQLARKWIISALIQQANLLAVEPLFFNLKISAQEKLRRKLLHSEAYSFRGNLESLVLNAPSSALVASGRIKFRLGCVIKCHCINPLIDTPSVYGRLAIRRLQMALRVRPLLARHASRALVSTASSSSTETSKERS